MYCVVLFSLAVFVLALILLYHLARKFYHKNYLQIRMNLYSTFDSLKTGCKYFDFVLPMVLTNFWLP